VLQALLDLSCMCHLCASHMVDYFEDILWTFIVTVVQTQFEKTVYVPCLISDPLILVVNKIDFNVSKYDRRSGSGV